jgi:hypothetical protein
MHPSPAEKLGHSGHQGNRFYRTHRSTRSKKEKNMLVVPSHFSRSIINIEDLVLN